MIRYVIRYMIRYMNSFSGCSLNIFITHFNDVPSFVRLKEYMNTFLPPNANIGIHDPIGLRYIFQLRVTLSPLRNHKFRPNFEDTPSDTCSCNQGNEDTNHFLLFCPIYIMTRAKLVASVTNILQKHNLNYLGDESHLLLYGHGSLSSFENKQILLSTIHKGHTSFRTLSFSCYPSSPPPI